MIQKSFILLPCHSLEDFPVFHTGDDASSTLANWTALWHPNLIHQCGKLPQWSRVDEPPEDAIASIVLVPTISADQLPTGYQDRLRQESSILIQNRTQRKEIVDLIMEQLEGEPADAELVRDFFALGYVYLQVQLMARMLRYTTYLDEVQFQNLLVAASEFAVKGETESCNEKLTACFDLLAEERNRFYPTDAFMIDLTLVADTTTGKSLEEMLGDTFKHNFVLSGKTLENLSTQKPELLKKLRGTHGDHKCFVSGQYQELPTQLMSPRSLLFEIKRCKDLYRELLDRECVVFSRRRFGLGNRLPGLLNAFGFKGAVHATMDEGSHPEGSHPNIRWDGIDGESINATGRLPVSAELPDAFLNLGVTIGEALDSAHTATMMFAHWPGQTCDAYQDLVRASRYGNVLGSFLTLDDYFDQVEDPGFGEEFTADQYSTPFYSQSLIRGKANALSNCVGYWQREHQLARIQAFASFANVVARKPVCDLDSQLQSLQSAQAESVEAEWDPERSNLLQTLEDESFERLTRQVAGSGEGERDSLVILNPFSFPRRCLVENSSIAPERVESKAVFAKCTRSNSMVVDVPPNGFLQLIDSGGKQPRSKKTIALTDELNLRNEFFEMSVDEASGGIRSIHFYGQRGNLLSQQLSMRQKAGRQSREGSATRYASMIAENVQVTKDTDVVAEITAVGKLVSGDDSAQELATFTQVYRVTRGIRVIDCELELTPTELPRNDPWNSYYCLRFAWANESGTLYRSVNDSRNAVSETRFEAPQYVEVDDAAHRISILTGGLPYHRRIGYRKLDSLLICHGETAQKFRFGIGVDLKNPLHHAKEFAAPVNLSNHKTKRETSHSAFLFHFDQRSLLATDWQSLFTDDGKCHGIRIRILESQNRAGKVRITAPYDVTRCHRTNFIGENEVDGQVENGTAVFEYGANDFFQVEIFWQA